MDSSPVKAYVALGANLGDREKNLRDALAMLNATPGVCVESVSSFFENPAVGGPADSPPFINAVAEINTTVAAVDLLHRMLHIERSLGRERKEKWGPRSIDLDILFYGDQIIHGDELVVPHPRLSERRFVLQPLAELAPGLIVPGSGKSVTELLDVLDELIPPSR